MKELGVWCQGAPSLLVCVGAVDLPLSLLFPCPACVSHVSLQVCSLHILKMHKKGRWMEALSLACCRSSQTEARLSRGGSDSILTIHSRCGYMFSSNLRFCNGKVAECVIFYAVTQGHVEQKVWKVSGEWRSVKMLFLDKKKRSSSCCDLHKSLSSSETSKSKGLGLGVGG